MNAARRAGEAAGTSGVVPAGSVPRWEMRHRNAPAPLFRVWWHAFRKADAARIMMGFARAYLMAPVSDCSGEWHLLVATAGGRGLALLAILAELRNGAPTHESLNGAHFAEAIVVANARLTAESKRKPCPCTSPRWRRKRAYRVSR